MEDISDLQYRLIVTYLFYEIQVYNHDNLTNCMKVNGISYIVLIVAYFIILFESLYWTLYKVTPIEDNITYRRLLLVVFF